MNNKKGVLIAIEGADGTGKTTQSNLLLKYFDSKKIPHTYFSFPRYEESLWAQEIRRYLQGEFGQVRDVDPYFVSLMYAGDRLSASAAIKKALDAGRIVLCNRYVGSNLAHMSAKLLPNQRKKYIDWSEDLEYKENGIPKEDLVLLLQVPPKVSNELMDKRVKDINENSKSYQEEVHDVYDEIATSRRNWVKVDCTDGKTIMKPEEINEKIIAILTARNIL